MQEHDNQSFELCAKICDVIHEAGATEQKEASLFLLDQLPLLQEERRTVVIENEQFHLSNQELINDTHEIKSELDRLRMLFDNKIDLEDALEDEIAVSLKDKLDHFHQRIEDEKSREKVSIITDLRCQVELIESQILAEDSRRNVLDSRLNEIVKEKAFTDKGSILEFFGRLIESRDDNISKLQKHIEALKVITIYLFR